MLKTLGIVAIVASMALGQVPRGEKQQKSYYQTNVTPYSILASAPFLYQPQIQPKENAPQNQPERWYEKFEKWIGGVDGVTWATWALVVVAIWAGCIAVRTVNAVEQQANHISASERAWMIADLAEPVFVAATKSGVIINPQVRNKGKTPAFILEAGGAAIVLKKDETLPQKPPPYPEEAIAKWDGAGIPLAPEGTIGGKVFSQFEDMQRIITGEMVLWAFGYVKYNDVFLQEVRETKYCFRWEPSLRNTKVPQYSIDGPEGYNQST